MTRNRYNFCRYHVKKNHDKRNTVANSDVFSNTTRCSNSIEFAPSVPTLDLHGYTKKKAISRLTWFLSDVVRTNSKKEGPITVTIITGTGSRSQDGTYVRIFVDFMIL